MPPRTPVRSATTATQTIMTIVASTRGSTRNRTGGMAYSAQDAPQLKKVFSNLPKDVTGGILTRPIPVSSTLPTHPSAATLAARELSRKQLEGAIRRSADLINIAKKRDSFS